MSDVVNALISSLSGETSLVQAEVAALNALISLYEALGGGIGNPADFGK
jgi:outer membrane protein TolC